MSKLTKTAPAFEHPADDLSEKISAAMRGMHDLREGNAALRDRNDELEHRRSVLESEIASLKAQLDNERNERRHYHSLASEIITRLDIVGRTVDDVVRTARHEVYSKRKDLIRNGELPELKIPDFLRNPIESENMAEASQAS